MVEEVSLDSEAIESCFFREMDVQLVLLKLKEL